MMIMMMMMIHYLVGVSYFAKYRKIGRLLYKNADKFPKIPYSAMAKKEKVIRNQQADPGISSKS